MVLSTNIRRDTMDYLISYEWINQGSTRKMTSIQRVSVNTHKTMDFTVYNNLNNSRYNLNYALSCKHGTQDVYGEQGT